jgi:hypothetical protein
MRAFAAVFVVSVMGIAASVRGEDGLTLGVVGHWTHTCLDRTWVSDSGESDPWPCSLDAYDSEDFSAGSLTLSYPIRHSLRLVSGLGYSGRGAWISSAHQYHHVRIHWLELPLQVRWTGLPEARISPFLQAGAYVGIRLGDASTDVTWTPDFDHGPTPILDEQKDQWSRMGLDLTVGGGVIIRPHRDVGVLLQLERGMGGTDLYTGNRWDDKARFFRFSLGIESNLRREAQPGEDDQGQARSRIVIGALGHWSRT